MSAEIPAPFAASESTQPNKIAVILTALEIETRAVLRQLGSFTDEIVSGTGFFRGQFEGWDVAVAEVGAGNAGAAAIAVRALAHYKPNVALFVGVAGGVKDVAIGDVVVGTKVYGYESGKDGAGGFKVRPDVMKAAHDIEHRARALRQREDWRRLLDPNIEHKGPSVFVGPIAAGEKVVASKKAATAKLIREHYGDALAVEMEGRGFLEAVHISQSVQGGVVRGISDLLSGKANADKAGSQRRAADAASAVAFEILSGIGSDVGAAVQPTHLTAGAKQKTGSDTPNILKLLKRSEQSPDILIAVGTNAFEIEFLNSNAPAPLSELELPWQSLASAVQPGDYNLLDALRWNFGLVEKLYGRDDELKRIIDWAERVSTPPSARLVTGEGGSGKTRLAAAAASALRERGWTAGFLKPGASLRIEIGSTKGLFLILDYPEENLDLMRALIKMLAATKNSAYPIRLLLLSRRDFDHWQAETLILEGRFGNHPIAAPGDLSLADVLELIEAAAANFARYARLSKACLDRAAVWTKETELHRLPLIAAAAAVHSVLAPQEAFGIEGGAIVRDLAQRERVRVRRTSEHLGIGSHTLGHLLALGTLGNGLNVDAIEKLVDANLCDGVPRSQIVEKIADTPWWKNGRLARLQPDRMAAAFLGAELFDARFPAGHRNLPILFSIALTGAEEGFGNRLGRILFDMDALGVAQGNARSLEEQLVEIIKRDPKQAVRFVGLTSQDVPYAAAGFAATIALALARSLEDEPAARASLLNNASNFLSRLGRREQALAVATEAVGLNRDLARARPEAFTPDLAGSLNSLAIAFSQLGRREEALAAATEGAGLYRDLANAQPEAFTTDLAMSLNNLAHALSELGQREEALAAATEASGLYRDLAHTRPETFTAELATSLNNLASMLSGLGRREQALAAATEAVTIRRDLARTRPEAFTPDLAKSVNTLAAMLSGLGRREEALAAGTEATELYRGLARARPEAFTSDLAMSLNNLANRLSLLGQHEKALATATEAVGLYRDLVRARPEAFTSDLAMSLSNLAKVLSELGQREAALASVTEAAGLYRDLARARAEAFTPHLAMSLNNLAAMLFRLGQREEALAAGTEAAELYRGLARARPEAFTSDLAASLNNLANLLSQFGQREAALAAAAEAVGLNRDLARAWPEGFKSDLAMSLNNLAGRLSELGRREEGLAASTEATMILRNLARVRPEVFTPDLAISLNTLANRLSELSRREAALAAATEAAGLYRDLARARPEAFTPYLALALDNLAGRLSELAQHEEALAAATEAVMIRRDLARLRPKVFTRDLAISLNILAKVLSRLGRREQARAADQEARGLLGEE